MPVVHLHLEGRVPSAKNHMQLIHVHGRVIPIKSKAYQRFRNEAIIQIKSQYHGKTINPHTLRVDFTLKGKLDADLDNLLGTICDILQDAGVIENDKTITEIITHKSHNGKQFYTEIAIRDDG